MVFNLEMLGYKRKQWLFTFAVGITGLFLLDATTSLVSWIVDYKLEAFPLISVRNILGLLFFAFSVSLYLNQVDYKDIRGLGWQATYYLFLITSILSGLYISEVTNELVVGIVNANIDALPIVSIKNILGVVLFVIAFKLYKSVRP